MGNRILLRAGSSTLFSTAIRFVNRGRYTRWGIVVSAVLAVFSFSDAVTDPSEPNNDTAHATHLSPGVSKGHSLLPAGEQDWYTFTLTERSKVIVNTYYTESNNFEVTTLNYYKDLGGGNLDHLRVDEQFSFEAISDPGVYYVQVTEETGLSLAEYDIGLSVLSAAPDRFEPDDVKTSATPLSFGVPVSGHTIAPEGDVDWYTFTVPNGVTDVVLEATIPSGGSSDAWGRIHITVFDGANTELLDSNQDDQVFLSVTPGVYYAKLEGSFGTDISAVYTVRLWNRNGPDAFENDNGPTYATWLPADGSMQTHNFYPLHDQDWYTFFANAGDTVAISFSNTAQNSEPVAAFFASNGTTQINIGSNVLNVATTGFYYVRVTNDPSITTTVDTVYTIGAPRQPPGLLPGALIGTVTSTAKGAAIPSATVAINFGSFTTQTDSSGTFAFPAIPPDTYQVTVSATGFQSANAAVGVGSGSTLRDFQLTPSPFAPSDIDHDGHTNAVDVQFVINKALGIAIGGRDADVNHDNQVNAVDVQLVINAALGL
jgi:hypothetical protein